MQIRNIRDRMKHKFLTVILFAYGLVVGTSAPLLLTRCASAGSGCSNCAGFCGLALGIVPLVIFVTTKSRVVHAARQALSSIRRTRNRSQEVKVDG